MSKEASRAPEDTYLPTYLYFSTCVHSLNEVFFHSSKTIFCPKEVSYFFGTFMQCLNKLISYFCTAL